MRTTPVKWVVRLGNAYSRSSHIPARSDVSWFFVLPELCRSARHAMKQMAPPGDRICGGALSRDLHSFASPRGGGGDTVAPSRPGRQSPRHRLTLPRLYRYVLLPMAFSGSSCRRSLRVLDIIKHASVALTIGLLELTGRARAMQEFSFKVFEAFAAATLIYLLTNLVVVLLMRALERKVRIPGFIGSAPQVPQAGH